MIALLLACTVQPTDTATALPADSGDAQTDDTIDTADTTDTVDTSDSGEAIDPDCVDVPVITYATFGEGFLTFYCQGCHGSESDDRFGAPKAVVFDDHASVLGWLSSIEGAVLGDEPIMPPAGGMPEDDLERLRIWINCWDGA